jgi:hypothetical protein
MDREIIAKLIMTTSIHAQDHQSFDIQCVPDRLQNNLKKNITRDRPGISLTPIRWGKGSESPVRTQLFLKVTMLHVLMIQERISMTFLEDAVMDI